MKPRLIIVGLLALVLIIVVTQNMEIVRIHFLFWEIVASQIILFPAIAFVGGVIGFIVGRRSKR